MFKSTYGYLAVALLVSLPVAAPALDVVTTPSRPGTVRGSSDNSDAFMWKLMTSQIAKPATSGQPLPASFETWGSDKDLYQTNPPTWPAAAASHSFHASVLAAAKSAPASGGYVTIDAGCAVPANPWASSFPTSGTPTPCIAEEVKHNKVAFDYVVNNHLYSRAGFASKYSGSTFVQTPVAAVAVKTDWVPVATLLQWFPNLKTQANVESIYLTTTANGVEYAMLSMHVSSKQNAAWVWATFEHRLNPGRCDFTGCYDSFGATKVSTPANKTGPGTQYGSCPKSAALQQLMSSAGLSSVWQNYCLRGTQTDYVAADGTPYVLGNSIIEGVNANQDVTASSCISCHSYASFGANGQPTAGAFAMLNHNANGKPRPNALVGSKSNDFTWGVLLAQ